MYISVGLYVYVQYILCSNRRLHSILQGISCNMIDKLADNDTQNLAQALAENPQWLSKLLVRINTDIEHMQLVICK